MCRLGLRAWRSKKPILCLHVVTDEDGNPLENEDESGGYVNIGVPSLRHALKSERHHCHETILRYVQKGPDDIRWESDRNDFDELMTTKGIRSRSRWDSI